MTPKVWHRRNAPQDAVYIGRGTMWGNPFKIGVDGTREEVIASYEALILSSSYHQNNIHQLRGKHLSCHCAPKACHGDVLLKWANKTDAPDR